MVVRVSFRGDRNALNLTAVVDAQCSEHIKSTECMLAAEGPVGEESAT